MTRHFTSNSTSEDDFFKTNLRIGTSSMRPLVDDFCTPTRHFTSNSTPQEDIFLTNLRSESSSCWLLHDDTQWVVLLLTIFARRLVTLRLIRRQKEVFFKTLRIDTSSTRPLVDDFCKTTRHFTSNSTSQDVCFKTTLCIDKSSTRPFVDDFCATTRHFTSNSTTLRTSTSSTRLHVEDFCTTTRHFTSNSTSQDVSFKTICG